MVLAQMKGTRFKMVGIVIEIIDGFEAIHEQSQVHRKTR